MTEEYRWDNTDGFNREALIEINRRWIEYRKDHPTTDKETLLRRFWNEIAIHGLEEDNA